MAREIIDKCMLKIEQDPNRYQADLTELFEQLGNELRSDFTVAMGATTEQIDNYNELKMIMNEQIIIDPLNPFDIKMILDKLKQLRKDSLFLKINRVTSETHFLTAADFAKGLIYWENPDYFGNEGDATPLINFWQEHRDHIKSIIGEYAVCQGFDQMIQKMINNHITELEMSDATMLHRNFKTLADVYFAKQAVYKYL